MSIDVKGQRLFVSALGNHTLEVIDLKAGKRTNTIRGLQKPQGALYVPGNDRLYVASSKDGPLPETDLRFGGRRCYFRFSAAGPDHYKAIARIPTVKGARTSFFSPDLDRLYLAVRLQGSTPAMIQVFALSK